MWKNLDANSKQTMPYLHPDRKALELHLASVMKHFNVTDEIIERHDWVKMFHKLAADTSRKVKQTKKFWLKLASTDPNDHLLPHEFNGSRLLHGRIQNGWAGAYVVYSLGWKPDIVIGLNISSGIAPPPLLGEKKTHS
jgi:hypothetical protein